jgi:hypothetical protein
VSLRLCAKKHDKRRPYSFPVDYVLHYLVSLKNDVSVRGARKGRHTQVHTPQKSSPDTNPKAQVGAEKLCLWSARCPFRATGRPVGRDGRDARPALETHSRVHVDRVSISRSEMQYF